jgi:hypothetical protein
MGRLTFLGEVLHEEHFRILVWISDLQNRVSGDAAEQTPDLGNIRERRAMHAVIRGLDHVLAHHAFEENEMFPLILGRAEDDLASLLTQDHAAIEPITHRLRVLTIDILRHGPGGHRWEEFCALAKDLFAEMITHLEREEMAILQRLDAFLDADTDHRLATRHLAARPSVATAAGAIYLG